MEIDEAIILLKQQYEQAKGLKFARNPLAYALYQTWKIVDSGKKWRNSNASSAWNRRDANG